MYALYIFFFSPQPMSYIYFMFNNFKLS
jgi:hypothetical protein